MDLELTCITLPPRYNDPGSADLIVQVNDCTFHLHRHVMAAFCNDIPQGQLRFNVTPSVNPVHGFDLFCQTVYGMTQLNRLNTDQLFALVFIADALQSRAVLAICDAALYEVGFRSKTWISSLQFARRYNLQKTLQMIVQENLDELISIQPLLLDDLPVHQFHHLLSTIRSPFLPKVRLILNYCSQQQVPLHECRNITIKGDLLIAAFDTLIMTVDGDEADKQAITIGLEVANRIVLIGDDERMRGPCLLYRIIAERALKLS